MLRFRGLGIALMSAVMTLVLVAGPVSVAQGADEPNQRDRTSQKEREDRYVLHKGVKVNNPLSAKRRVILNHIIRAINHTPKDEKIRIASWNIRSDAFVHALVLAHQRGVSVRVLISLGNANPSNPNRGFNRLASVVNKGNKDRPASMKSWARKCDRSCRGKHGIAHTKMYMFSKVRPGKDAPEDVEPSRNVVMFGSANATDVAVRYQWNDMYTVAGRPAVYDDFIDIFNEMKKDKPVFPPYVEYQHGKLTYGFLPWGGGKAIGDPTLNELKKIRCDGATGGTGVNGHTIVRIAQTAILDKRGIAIAERLKAMWNRGCDIKIVYALMGNDVLSVVRSSSGRGPIPIQQVAQDWQNDGIYDRYLHLKVMTVSGVYGEKTDAEVSFNGSANWTGLTLRCDDVIARVFNAKVRNRYTSWINWLFQHPPPQGQAFDDADRRYSTRTDLTRQELRHHGVEL